MADQLIPVNQLQKPHTHKIRETNLIIGVCIKSIRQCFIFLCGGITRTQKLSSSLMWTKSCPRFSLSNLGVDQNIASYTSPAAWKDVTLISDLPLNSACCCCCCCCCCLCSIYLPAWQTTCDVQWIGRSTCDWIYRVSLLTDNTGCFIFTMPGSI